MSYDSISHTLCHMAPCFLPHAATRYWHGMVAAVASQFCDSDIVFAVANEEDYPDDLRYDIISGDASHLHWRSLPSTGPWVCQSGERRWRWGCLPQGLSSIP